MEIEIIEAYEIRFKEGDKPKGWSLHIYLPEWEMDVRGIILKKYGGGWFMQMPFLTNYDKEEKKPVRFPLISFLERDKTKDLNQKIKEKAVEYVEKKLKKL